MVDTGGRASRFGRGAVILCATLTLAFGWWQGVAAESTALVSFQGTDATTGAPVDVEGVLDPDTGDFLWWPTKTDPTLPVGTHELMVIASGYGADYTDGSGHYGTLITIDVLDGSNNVIQVAMEPPATVRFQVRDDLGAAVEDLSILGAALRPDGLNSRSTTAGPRNSSNGWFELPVHPAPTTTSLSVQGRAARTLTDLPAVPSGGVLELAEPIIVQAGASLRGVVRDPLGQPVEGARIVTQLTNTFDDPTGGFEVGADGAFEFSDLGHAPPEWMVVLPPTNRPDLGAGGPSGVGLVGIEVTGDAHHAEANVVLPYGSWTSSHELRQRPNPGNPVTVTMFGWSHDIGANVMSSSHADSAGWTSLGLEVQVRRGDPYPLLIDIDEALVPDGHVVTVGINGGPPLTCTLELSCGAWRSQGPEGRQLVVDLSVGGVETVQLYSGVGAPALYLDPPLVALSNFWIDYDIDVHAADGCTHSITYQLGEVSYPLGLPPNYDPGLPWWSMPQQTPGIIDLKTSDWTLFNVKLSAGGSTAVFVQEVWPPHWIQPDDPALAFGGLDQLACQPAPPPPTTTTVPPTTTTAPPVTTTTTLPPTTTTTTTTPPPATTTTTTTTAPPTSTTSTAAPTTTSTTTTAAPQPQAADTGYVVVTRTGTAHPFGDIEHRGNATTTHATKIALHPSGRGYWILAADGTITAFGDAAVHGAPIALDPGEHATTMAAHPDGNGYWIITQRGRVIPRGTAQPHGDLTAFDLAGDVIDAAATPTGNGYYLVGSDGGIFAFGDADFTGSIPQVLPGVTLDQPVVGITPDPDGTGYWLVAADGGVFAFDAPFRGSIPGVLPPGTDLVATINGMVPYGNGYLLVAGDGGVFAFSNLPFLGSLGNTTLDAPIVAIDAN